jgi:hypothetical protein
LIPSGFSNLGLNEQPEMYLNLTNQQGTYGYSHLQIAWIATVISNAGLQPAPKLVTGYALTQDNWQVFPVLAPPRRVMTATEVDQIVANFDYTQEIFWEVIQNIATTPASHVTWYVGGTIPGWEGRSLTLTVLLEDASQDDAQQIGQAILKTVIP